AAGIHRDLQRQCGRGTGEHDHHAARLRDEQQVHRNLRCHAEPPDPALMLPVFRRFAVVFLAAALGGCAMIPPEPIVTGPLTAEPPSAFNMPMAEPNGSIYQPTAYGSYPLFED